MDLQVQNRFHLHQQPALMNNRYRIFLDDAGKPGELIGFVEQQQGTLTDHVIVYTDEDKHATLAEFRARKLIDVAPACDVFTPEGEVIGSFQKNFAKSLYRSTWTLEQSGEPPITVKEHNKVLAVVRRAWTLVPTLGEFPFPARYRFDFRQGGKVVGGMAKSARLSDNYVAWIDTERADRRLILAMAVALDTRQGP